MAGSQHSTSGRRTKSRTTRSSSHSNVHGGQPGSGPYASCPEHSQWRGRVAAPSLGATKSRCQRYGVKARFASAQDLLRPRPCPGRGRYFLKTYAPTRRQSHHRRDLASGGNPLRQSEWGLRQLHVRRYNSGSTLRHRHLTKSMALQTKMLPRDNGSPQSSDCCGSPQRSSPQNEPHNACRSIKRRPPQLNSSA